MMLSHQRHDSPETQQAQQMTDQLTGLGKDVGKQGLNAGKKVGKKMGKKIGKEFMKMGGKALKKVAMMFVKALAKSLLLFAKAFAILLAIILVIVIIWWIVYEIRGKAQDYTMDPEFDSNTFELAENASDKIGGFFKKISELTGENKAVKEYYSQYGGKRSYWQIPYDPSREDLIRGDEEDAVTDYYNKERRYTVNANFLFGLDEAVYKRKFRYVEQFVEPMSFNREEMKIVHLTDEEGMLTAESTKYDKEGMKTDEKEEGVWDYGLGSIFKYKKDKITKTVEGTYTGMSVWDSSSESVVVKPLNEPYVEVMEGYPIEIDLMTHAVTYTGDYEFKYENVKTLVTGAKGEIRAGDDSSSINDPVNRIKIGTYKQYKDVPVYGYVDKVEIIDGVEKIKKVYEQTGTEKVFVKEHPLYKYRTAEVYETKPVEIPSPALPEEEQKKIDEQRLRYLEDYLFYFESYIPTSVMEAFNFEERVGQIIETNMEVGGSADFQNGNFASSMQHYATVKKYAEIYGVEAEAIIAMMAQESGGKANIEDGVMQITGDGRRCITETPQGPDACVDSEDDRRNPERAIAWGVAHFSKSLAKYNGDYLKAIQSHNLDPGWIFKTYPETEGTLDWLNYREPMREHYGEAEGYGLTRSASYACMPGFDESEVAGRTRYGDVCYLENVLRYYKGTMLAGIEDVDANSNTEDIKENITNAFKSFFGISKKDYLEDEKRHRFKHRMKEKETDTILKSIKTFNKEVEFSKLDEDDNVEFWESGGDMLSAGSGKSLSRDEFLAIVGDVQYAPPLDIPNPRVTAKFGSIDSAHATPHLGMDVGVPIGTPYYAVMGGTIHKADGTGSSGWGKYVQIKLDDGNYALYAHMNYVPVTVGQRVEMGDYIGDSGNTGNSTGPHLHFEWTYQSPARSSARDPYWIVIQPELFGNM